MKDQIISLIRIRNDNTGEETSEAWRVAEVLGTDMMIGTQHGYTTTAHNNDLLLIELAEQCVLYEQHGSNCSAAKNLSVAEML